jgi:methionine biosynthesis protein MetW
MTDQEQALLAARPDFAAIASWVAPGARILDLGCGDGSLLRYLWQARQAPGYGVEIDDDSVLACVANDVNVLQVDLESGLSLFSDHSFDTVVLSQTLQAMRRVEDVLREMARVARFGIVSFPNFGHWRHAWSLLRGHMPVTRQIPYQWYDTPNIHLCTPRDFEALARECGLVITDRALLADGRRVGVLPSLRATLAVYRFASAT